MLNPSDENLMLLAGMASAQEWQRKQNLMLESMVIPEEDNNDCPHGIFDKRESSLGEVLGLKCVKCGKQWDKVGTRDDGKMLFVPVGLVEKKE